MRFMRAARIELAALAALFACAQFLPATSSSFSATTSLSGNSLAAGPDWAPPTVTATAIQKTAGGLYDNSIKQGGTFYVYANVTDTGNPSSGISTVTASVANVATVSSAALTAGSYTVNGTSYNYRSGSLTAKNPLTTNSYSYSVSATDGAG